MSSTSEGDITSQIPLVRSLGLLEKMAQGFAIAMDDDFNSREACAKVLGAIREMSKMLGAAEAMIWVLMHNIV